MQSVKPPVEAPTSIHIFLSKVTPNLSIAFSSLSPPRLTYFNVLPRTSILTVSLKNVPALSSLSLLTKTIPLIIIAFAFSLDSAKPLLTNKTSNLSFIL